MAIRETLGVAACSIALAATCFTGGLPAAAATLGAPSSIAAQPNTVGTALPTQAQLEAAKSDPEALSALVDQLESEIESGRQRIITAEAAALDAQDILLDADQLLAERTQAADEAKTEAEKATEFLLSSKKDVGALASDLYRNGGVNPGVVTLLEDSKDNDVLYKASTMDALSANRTMTVSNAEDAAALWTAWQDYAAAAAEAADEATSAQRTAAAKATTTLSSYQDSIAPQEQLREQLIGQLAFLHEVDAAKEAERIAAKEAAAEAKKLQELIDNAPQAKPLETQQSKAPEIKPLAAPPKVPTERPQGQTLVPKASVPKAPQLTVAVPPRAPESAPAPKPETTQAPKPTPKPESPKETAKPKPEATQAPKPAPKPKETAKPEAPRETAKPKPKPSATPKPPTIAPQAPKESVKPKPEPETSAPQSSRNYNAAFAWGRMIANDDSKQYRYGANGPDFYDCSSFAQAAYSKSGISLPRSSSQQYAAAPTKVPISQLRRGDLVFSSSNGGNSFYHVAIYLGGGQVLHARNPNSGISVTPLSWVNNLHPYAGRY
ncbi:NlpC/P60 family protein [Paeniglutamicibacter psychrophenolicus]|uniref:NlpC/P60 family protein n=1 Tax=Paeniglutamicibacter psychrophenolicus TaxID=257454 RepID=UPI002786C05E|nr:NlpC/P60 family protein [Paeniglutamicibacter psychrophenolicus]MDQ0093850.1 cell wall-associated NlpC family hydrolase [Paeniglutamicibacter psychrophenolicus]